MRLNRYFVVMLAVVLAGCGTPEQTPVIDDSTMASSTPTTTTSAPSTTSTVAPTATTTTVPVPEGDALVVSRGFVLGWWADGAWQQDAEYRPLETGAEFQIFSVDDEPYLATGGEAEVTCEWIDDDTRHIPLELSASSSLFGPIGVSAPWQVDAGQIASIDADQALTDIAVDLLADVGIDDPNPAFAQVIETDLNGDGAEETIAVLDRNAGIYDAGEDAYGIAFVVHAGSAVQLIGEYQLAEIPVQVDGADEIHNNVAQYRVLAVMDVNSDGKTEVAMHSNWVEGGGEGLYALDSETSQLTRVLGEGCGA